MSCFRPGLGGHWQVKTFKGLLPMQDLHRLEKYLNIQGCLEKSLKIKIVLKST